MVILIAVTLGVCFGLPGQMASMFEGMGNYSFAVRFASLAYTYSGDYNDLARCADDSILSARQDDIIKFAYALKTDEEFGEYCQKRDEEMNSKLQSADIEYAEYSYRQFIMGNLACAYYQAGNKEGALETAAEAMVGEGFPKNNACAMLAARAAEKEDGETKAELLSLVQTLSPLPGQEDYYRAVTDLLCA